MLTSRLLVWMCPIALMVIGMGAAGAQNYPNQTIRIVTGNPGGALDLSARMIAQGIAGSLGQQVIIENRMSAGGAIAVQTVIKAPPDGHTLLLYGGNIWLFQFMADNVPWDTIRDLAPITLAIKSPSVLLVHPSLPVKSVAALIALAKSRPGELNEAGVGSGNATHMASELFKSMAHVNIVRVPYKGGGPALIALVGGEMQLTFSVAGAALPYVKSGRLRALAITSAQPSPLIPELPTIAASGLPGYEAESLFGLFAPANTPATIINRLNQEIVRFLTMAETRKRFLNSGLETVGGSPEQLLAAVKSDMAKWGKLIKDVGIRR